MAVAESRVMSSNQSQVVVAFDFSHSGQAALYRAVALASRAPFHVLHFACVIDPHHGIPSIPTKHIDQDYVTRVRDEIAALAEQELSAAGTAAKVHFSIHVLISRHPAKEILRVAEYVGADLIIVGSKGLTGIERIVLGSVSEHVVREAKCSVVIARPKEYAYVPLLDVVEVEKQPVHERAHRYTYEDHRASLRPSDWPIY